MSEPKSITLSQNPKGIFIEWPDGHKGLYPFAYLRRACPCAFCKGERMPLSQEPKALPVLTNLAPEAFNAKDMYKVGRYALGFKWGDEHSSGIYTFEYLRDVCPCEMCRANF